MVSVCVEAVEYVIRNSSDDCVDLKPVVQPVVLLLIKLSQSFVFNLLELYELSESGSADIVRGANLIFRLAKLFPGFGVYFRE